MKKLYWRPERISKRVLLIVALFAVAGVFTVETFKVERRQPYFKEKIAAAHLARRAFEAVKEERLKRKIRLDREADPAASGLIGELLTPVTTNPGHLPAKQTSINPNFAAVVVHLLKRVGVSQGDVVAVGLSGSFPALNLSVLAAVQTIGAKTALITSIGASQWGANIPNLLWPDMESTVAQQKIIRVRSAAYSLGGIDDRALGLLSSGKEALNAAILRSGIPKLEVTSYDDSVEKRVNLYREVAADQDIAAYINVGGGTSSVGTRMGKKLFKPGLNRLPPQGITEFDSVMSRFSLEGIPVIHLSSIDNIADRYGLPLQPRQIPEPGIGKVFRREVYNTWLAAATLAVILLFLWIFARLDLGYRLLSRGSRQKASPHPQQMV
jgi:poly-gamma-glutamate system protein